MTLSVVLLLIAAFCALLVGRLQPAPERWAVPWLTLSIVAALALAGVAQWLWPDLLARFERDAGAIRGGEAYRLFTALWFQDGGVAGGVFNLAMALMIGAIAERLWGAKGWLLIYFGAGLAAEIIALWWQPIGAGNSVAWMGLAGSVLIAAWVGARPVPAMIPGAIGLAAGAGLALMRDIHGAGMLVGALTGLVLIRTGHGLCRRPEDAAPLA